MEIAVLNWRHTLSSCVFFSFSASPPSKKEERRGIDNDLILRNYVVAWYIGCVHNGSYDMMGHPPVTEPYKNDPIFASLQAGLDQIQPFVGKILFGSPNLAFDNLILAVEVKKRLWWGLVKIPILRQKLSFFS
ncbi:hypothetical protein Ddc_22428 [Ditylenchus destructor]|nr:hypothetical protein Ddc_22428 [Ditylenchus destructor]